MTDQSALLGEGAFRYEALPQWEQLPDGVSLVDVPGVAIDRDDNVYLLTRDPNYPVLVFSPDGAFLRSFGQGTFSNRAPRHPLRPGWQPLLRRRRQPHDHPLVQGRRTARHDRRAQPPPPPPGAAAPSTAPPTPPCRHAAATSYITDGYGNSCVHVFSPQGRAPAHLGGGRYRSRTVHSPPQRGHR